ncbi:MAG: molecular chaperone Hsp33 [Candidatus Accumulibacter sp.]|nr:molecular chaperone Hsp33 [Accumulibacter sp.]MBA4093586.1 molecular chaperone Hsp33 [Accumulibacter sp.]MBN9421604.1 Hsp33 family molecular chaperone HslO [Accumulibacter sp.]OJW50409.1 MAG: molecular chaperone Hsp33 [Candidatus Accumulibacter sp. 66-26]
MENYVQRFLLDDLDIRGAVVRLGPVWQQMLAGRDYPAPVARLLGEMSATTLLIGGNLKQPGRITFQLRGSGPVSLLVIDCNERLHIRGMAKCDEAVPAAQLTGNAPDLLGHGQLLLSLDLPSMREPYQSFVPLDGNSIAEIFEHYLKQSEQQPARFFLAADEHGAAGLFLQKLPGADERDADGWARIEHLASTVKPEELLGLPAEELLLRLFHEETVRVFDPRPVVHDCPEDWEKVRSMLRSLGRAEVDSILQEHGEVLIKDDICNREYRFDAQAIEELFRENPPTLH